ncbi:hypothetical protein C922_00433 [Plasmodium inui San Antonio 1]|uniref:Uncharacterized protein n=1 Tax=Plasmodium inui San Antonio 1 TaxID=1237626 RepID=W7ALC8_9APIC|nr:hypothetical protein C922_00433 [Plasmodium inui San Antonio 1]EUD69569.1 hypothetical protein C922_00433 [Plasmodium inui San Antonio 1]
MIIFQILQIPTIEIKDIQNPHIPIIEMIDIPIEEILITVPWMETMKGRFLTITKDHKVQ